MTSAVQDKNKENSMKYNVNISWDSEAMVWIATSDDISGLVLESGSLDALIERVKIAVPELVNYRKTQTTKFLLTSAAGVGYNNNNRTPHTSQRCSLGGTFFEN